MTFLQFYRLFLTFYGRHKTRIKRTRIIKFHKSVNSFWINLLIHHNCLNLGMIVKRPSIKYVLLKKPNIWHPFSLTHILTKEWHHQNNRYTLFVRLPLPPFLPTYLMDVAKNSVLLIFLTSSVDCQPQTYC